MKSPEPQLKSHVIEFCHTMGESESVLQILEKILLGTKAIKQN